MLKPTQSIMVTGAAGFIGFHVSQVLLKAGYNVVGVDNLNDYYDVNLKHARLNQLQTFANFIFHKVDIADRVEMTKIWDHYPDIDQIIHLAAQAGVRYSLINPFAYVHSNLLGHLVILELCRHRQNFKHLVYASSSSVYGSNKNSPFSVLDRTDSPISLYSATKKADELMSQAYTHLYKIPSTGLRFFTVYGPWGRPDMSAYLFAKAILEDKPIQVFNQGNMKRDFTYIDDIVAGIIGALNRNPVDAQGLPNHQVYNLGNNHCEPLMNFIELIEKALGKQGQKDLLPMQPGDVAETFADITESTRDFNFMPKIQIAEGIPLFIDWFKEFHQQFKTAV
jgi:UDP-glucuronate 4-epimerase